MGIWQLELGVWECHRMFGGFLVFICLFFMAGVGCISILLYSSSTALCFLSRDSSPGTIIRWSPIRLLFIMFPDVACLVCTTNLPSTLRQLSVTLSNSQFAWSKALDLHGFDPCIFLSLSLSLSARAGECVRRTVPCIRVYVRKSATSAAKYTTVDK